MEEADVVKNNLDQKLDCEGFLEDKKIWSKDMAELMAKANEIGEYRLSDEHWKVINYVREYYEEHGTGPAVVRVAKDTGLNLKDICRLFPCGLVKGAYKLAGLPKPPGCT
jgi:tRNA 2-thiouridine synthesizing protein E